MKTLLKNLLLTSLLSIVALAQNTLTWPCLNPPTLSKNIPSDTILSDQPSFNCFAWQEFISLNWSIDPKEEFGKPYSFTPVVFETYMSTQEFLKPDGSTPPTWEKRAFSTYEEDTDIRTMHATSKITIDFDPNADLNQAFPNNSNKAWLADKEGNLVWYEILVNKDEYQYIYNNKFYNSMEQYKAIDKGKHIDLPKGSLNGKIGAMEFKAAWLTIKNPKDKKWEKYKLTKAKICSTDGGCKTHYFALVGLHIIHKMASQPSWLWATFEHMDNAPDIADVEAKKVGNNFTFYNPDYKVQNIDPQCVNGYLHKKTLNKPNIPPLYPLSFQKGEVTGKCKPYPIQVARKFPLPHTDENPIVQTNKAAHQLIKEDNKNSVYQYYNLVNVLWNDSPVDENKGKQLPINGLSQTGFRPTESAFPVANTMLETYIQGNTCVSCHSQATVTNPKDNIKYATDYSFVFGLAGSSQK